MQKIPKCHLLATTGAVSIVWQPAWTGCPLGAMRSARLPGLGMEVPKMLKKKSCSMGKRQTADNFNSSYIWKATEFHAHILQIRKLRLNEIR